MDSSGSFSTTVTFVTQGFTNMGNISLNLAKRRKSSLLVLCRRPASLWHHRGSVFNNFFQSASNHVLLFFLSWQLNAAFFSIVNTGSKKYCTSFGRFIAIFPLILSNIYKIVPLYFRVRIMDWVRLFLCLISFTNVTIQVRVSTRPSKHSAARQASHRWGIRRSRAGFCVCNCMVLNVTHKPWYASRGGPQNSVNRTGIFGTYRAASTTSNTQVFSFCCTFRAVP